MSRGGKVAEGVCVSAMGREVSVSILLWYCSRGRLPRNLGWWRGKHPLLALPRTRTIRHKTLLAVCNNGLAERGDCVCTWRILREPVDGEKANRLIVQYAF